MKRVHFVDTSILCCMLRLPHFCDAEYAAVLEEFERIATCSDVLLLPLASVIETGNHIANVGDGNVRRAVAITFADYLRDTVDNKAPWAFVEARWTARDLSNYADKFSDCATRKIGFGDLSIIEEYRDYISRVPGVSVRIWSLDHHLASHCYEAPEIDRRKGR